MPIQEENAPIYITRCHVCGAKGAWAATSDEAIRFAKQDGWLVRRAKRVSESWTLCPLCRKRALR